MADPAPTLADITPDWLTRLLQKPGQDIRVSTVSAKPIGTGQVGATYRLTLGYDGYCAKAPPTLVAKFPSNDPVSRATGKTHLTYVRESRFYQLFAGEKPMAVPDHLFVAFDEESHDFALIMHDLPTHVAGDQLSVPSHDESCAAMDAAATIHAAWWGDPMLDKMDWLNGSKSATQSHDLEQLYSYFWPAFCARYATRISPDIQGVGDAFVGRMADWQSARTGPRCLTHNDFRPDNMMIALSNPQKPVVIVDWQTVGVGQGVTDVAYYTGTALDPATRKAEERFLLERYRQQLIRNGVPPSDLDHLWQDYCKSAFSGFLMGVTASMVVEQTERGDAMFLTMCERAAAMVLDHGEGAMPARA